MDARLLLLILLALTGAAGLCWILRKLASPQARLPLTVTWIEELSAERYRPMMRLLESWDLDVLREHPGFTPAAISRLRRQRCRIFHGYLLSLREDFARVSMALKLILVQSRNDRPDLSTALLRSQWLFAAAFVALEFRLLLYSWGLGRVSATPLVHIFENMRLELQGLVPVTMGMGA